jgi:hypothetical protein
MQIVAMDEGELVIHLRGYTFSRRRRLLYYLSCILSCGIVYLIARWVPRWWKKWNQLVECSFEHATFIEIEASVRRSELSVVTPGLTTFFRTRGTRLRLSRLSRSSSMRPSKMRLGNRAKVETRDRKDLSAVRIMLR